MKTKSRGNFKTFTNAGWLKDYNIQPDGSEVLTQQSSWSSNLVNGEIATITYDDSKRHGKLKRTRKCDHVTSSYEGSRRDFSYYLNSTKTKLRRCRQGGAIYLGDLSLPTNLGSVHNEALTFFQAGCTKMEFQLGVDLIEWRETLNLLKALRPKLKSLTNLLREATNYKAWLSYARSLEISIREMTFKDVANYHLAYNFGVKPLVSDIMALFESLSGLQEKVAWLRKNQGKPVKVRFSKDLSKSYAPSGGVIYDDSIEQDVLYIRHYSCKYRAHALIVYDTQKLNDAELALRVLCRQVGLDAGLGMLWETIPYSFLVDWVFRVGEWLDQFDSHVTLPYTFLDVGWSVSIVEDRCLTYYYKYPHKESFMTAYGARRTRYYREPGIPASLSSVQTGLPGAEQLVLAMSLAVQRFG